MSPSGLGGDGRLGRQALDRVGVVEGDRGRLRRDSLDEVRQDFAGTDQDIKAFERFIIRYITVNQRWNSPKFLFGESYGTTRSGGLVAALVVAAWGAPRELVPATG